MAGKHWALQKPPTTEPHKTDHLHTCPLALPLAAGRPAVNPHHSNNPLRRQLLGPFCCQGHCPASVVHSWLQRACQLCQLLHRHGISIVIGAQPPAVACQEELLAPAILSPDTVEALQGGLAVLDRQLGDTAAAQPPSANNSHLTGFESSRETSADSCLHLNAVGSKAVS